jgi:anthranilate 1,2-dioxygenase small subunit
LESIPAGDETLSDALSEARLYMLLNQTQTAYSRCIDDRNAEGWPDFFDDECLYVVTTSDNYREGMRAGLIYADSKGMLRDRISALNEANIYERHSYRHFLSQPTIVSREGALFRAETGFMVVRIMRTGETALFATGRYIDLYRIDNEQLLIRERKVVCDSNQIDTLLALPL